MIKEDLVISVEENLTKENCEFFEEAVYFFRMFKEFLEKSKIDLSNSDIIDFLDEELLFAKKYNYNYETLQALKDLRFLFIEEISNHRIVREERRIWQ